MGCFTFTCPVNLVLVDVDCIVDLATEYSRSQAKLIPKLNTVKRAIAHEVTELKQFSDAIDFARVNPFAGLSLGLLRQIIEVCCVASHGS